MKNRYTELLGVAHDAINRDPAKALDIYNAADIVIGEETPLLVMAQGFIHRKSFRGSQRLSFCTKLLRKSRPDVRCPY